uniref:Uncharacterized protein n=1 Tax=Lotus japonicus TaxID=34305 RepID=I3SJV1_LOTJA|nr:unknown [Lotus japonicus]
MNNNPSPTNNHGFLDSLRSGFLGTNNNNVQNLYYGYGNGDMGEVENGVGVSGDMMLPYDQELSSTIATTQAVTVTTMKQELCSGREQNESKVLWGFPWQLNNGDHTRMGGELDSGRANWNGLTPS